MSHPFSKNDCGGQGTSKIMALMFEFGGPSPGRRVAALALLSAAAMCIRPAAASSPFVRIHTPGEGNICYTAGGRADVIDGLHVRLPDMRAVDNVEAVTTCCDLCHTTPGCIAFTYNRALHVCHLQVRQSARDCSAPCMHLASSKAPAASPAGLLTSGQHAARHATSRHRLLSCAQRYLNAPSLSCAGYGWDDPAQEGAHCRSPFRAARLHARWREWGHDGSFVK